MNHIDTMKLALEALETLNSGDTYKTHNAATALRQAIEQAQQAEPVAYLCENAVGHKYFRWKKPSSTYKPIALYTSPLAQRTWVDLTDDEIKKEFHPLHATGLQFARAVLAKSKEKNA